MDDSAKNINISALIQKVGHGSIDDFDLNDMDRLESWCGPIDGILRVRTLSAMITRYSSAELIISCAQSMAILEQWRDLLVDFLRTSEINPAAIDVARQVLRQTMLAHPLAALESAPAQAIGVYDAISDGERLTFIPEDTPVQGGQWIFFDVADPVDLAARASVTIEDGRVSVQLKELAWIDPHRAACPAFAAVAG